VVPEYQCAVKREAKKAQKDKEKPNSTTLSPTPTTKNNLNHMNDIEMKVRWEENQITPNTTTSSPNGSLLSSLSSLNGRKNGRCLSMEQEELINRLVYFQDEFEQPSEDDLKRLTVRIIFNDS
ncbi:unnamed protein product, partial [Allacma fusca]